MGCLPWRWCPPSNKSTWGTVAQRAGPHHCCCVQRQCLTVGMLGEQQMNRNERKGSSKGTQQEGTEYKAGGRRRVLVKAGSEKSGQRTSALHFSFVSENNTCRRTRGSYLRGSQRGGTSRASRAVVSGRRRAAHDPALHAMRHALDKLQLLRQLSGVLPAGKEGANGIWQSAVRPLRRIGACHLRTHRLTLQRKSSPCPLCLAT